MRPVSSGELILALQPSARGLAYIIFEGPLSPAVWQIKDIRGAQKLRLTFQAVIELITRYEPDVLVIESKIGTHTRQMGTRRRLERMLVAYARGRGLDVYAYTRANIRSCFAAVGAVTRREIAEAIAGQIHAFHRLPPKRKPWDPEHRRMSLFDAASLAMTYYARDGNFRTAP